MDPGALYFLRYAPEGFQLSGASRDTTIDVYGKVLASQPSLVSATSPLSITTQTVCLRGRFYAACAHELLEFSPAPSVRMGLRRHGNNALFRHGPRLCFLDQKGAVFDVSDFALSPLCVLRPASRTLVHSVFGRTFAFLDAALFEVRDLRLEPCAIQPLLPLKFSSVNLLIDADDCAFDLLTQKAYPAKADINTDDMAANAIPMEIGWVLRKEWFDRHFDGDFDEIRGAGSREFQDFFRREFEALKRENGVK
ncbi:hypothetical protein SS50377_25315 [Spironucleus salmonicida]|uniref:Uncharacterized protein n=1 Tax=Spironucleus salmonicida TaxID=348837 RepID=A0A9P8LS33_9EUKA|nr:hypothetical protein SS50377_25315 [Spironucleus salmonicida]